MKNKKLKENYYIDKFCKKQELTFDGWVGDEVGGIAWFGDVLFFNFQDIVWDINSKQDKDLIINWIYESLDNQEKAINYFSYSKGLRYNDINKSVNKISK